VVDVLHEIDECCPRWKLCLQLLPGTFIPVESIGPSFDCQFTVCIVAFLRRSLETVRPGDRCLSCIGREGNHFLF
jgi:hypothetical protein